MSVHRLANRELSFRQRENLLQVQCRFIDALLGALIPLGDLSCLVQVTAHKAEVSLERKGNHEGAIHPIKCDCVARCPSTSSSSKSFKAGIRASVSNVV